MNPLLGNHLLLTVSELSFLIPEQQVQIYAKINLNALSPNNQYLAFD